MELEYLIIDDKIQIQMNSSKLSMNQVICLLQYEFFQSFLSSILYDLIKSLKINHLLINNINHNSDIFNIQFYTKSISNSFKIENINENPFYLIKSENNNVYIWKTNMNHLNCISLDILNKILTSIFKEIFLEIKSGIIFKLKTYNNPLIFILKKKNKI